ncbi:MAG: hypothetical protein O2812_00375 [Chloroflexi bacterium]|nr:hypothetical protein [Chloroflexota bacterium]
MAEILGIGTTDFPMLRETPGGMTGVLYSGLSTGTHYKPETKDPKNWPEPMQKEWSDDFGRAAGIEKQQRQFEMLRKIRGTIDDFKPDFILIWSKDARESLGNYCIAPYVVQAHEEVQCRLFDGSIGASLFGLDKPLGNAFGQDPERMATIKGHPVGALHLVRGLQDAGLNPTYSTEARHPNGLAHTFCGVVTHLDIDRFEFPYPVVPVSVNPFATRQRGSDGLAPLNPNDPKPISPKHAFDLGRATARILRASPWRVVLCAGVGWSHAQNTSWERQWVHPDMEGDRKFHEQWKNNQFDKWDQITAEDLEKTANWELVNWIALAGAMTELGAKVEFSDLQENWAFNSNWVNTIFSVA